MEIMDHRGVFNRFITFGTVWLSVCLHNVILFTQNREIFRILSTEDHEFVVPRIRVPDVPSNLLLLLLRK